MRVNLSRHAYVHTCDNVSTDAGMPCTYVACNGVNTIASYHSVLSLHLALYRHYWKAARSYRAFGSSEFRVSSLKHASPFAVEVVVSVSLGCKCLCEGGLFLLEVLSREA